MHKIRLFFALFALLLCIIMLAPLQMLALKLNMRPIARFLPLLFHRILLQIIGVRVKKIGSFNPNSATLLVSNHISWIDIIALGSIAPLAFIAKSEIAHWPVFGFLAKLQRTVFADRSKKMDTKRIGSTMEERFAKGETLVLFAEGTTGMGHEVLPFKPALVGAAMMAANNAEIDYLNIQAVSIHYTHWHGLPIGKAEMPFIAWYGDMDMASHVGHLLKSGGIDVTITIHPPIQNALLEHRKAITLQLESAVRADIQGD